MMVKTETFTGVYRHPDEAETTRVGGDESSAAPAASVGAVIRDSGHAGDSIYRCRPLLQANIGEECLGEDAICESLSPRSVVNRRLRRIGTKRQ